MRRSTLSLLFAAVTMLLATPALARRGGGGLMNPRVMARLADALQLDETTRERIRVIAQETKRQVVDLRSQIEQNRTEMKTLMEADDPPKARIMALIDEFHALKARKQKLRIGALIDIRAQLTPEQRAQMKTLRSQFRERRGKRGRRGRRRGQ